MTTNRADLLRVQVMDAALSCFGKYGPQRTSMADVADEAKLSRQSVYRAFATRSELIQAILDRRILEMGATLQPYFASLPPLTEALVEGSIRSLRVARNDTLYRQIIEHSTDHSIEKFLVQGSESIRNMMLGLWGPIFDRARTDGQLRPGITNEQLIDWVMGVHSMLHLRDDMGDDALRVQLETFFVPSVCA